ncbi:hypothetical protein PG989_000554 [Apiospora arundinis]
MTGVPGEAKQTEKQILERLVVYQTVFLTTRAESEHNSFPDNIVDQIQSIGTFVRQPGALVGSDPRVLEALDIVLDDICADTGEAQVAPRIQQIADIVLRGLALNPGVSRSCEQKEMPDCGHQAYHGGGSPSNHSHNHSYNRRRRWPEQQQQQQQQKLRRSGAMAELDDGSGCVSAANGTNEVGPPYDNHHHHLLLRRLPQHHRRSRRNHHLRSGAVFKMAARRGSWRQRPGRFADEFKKDEKAKKRAAPIQKKWEEDRKKAADKKGERPYLYSRMSRSVNNIPIANV